jgi:predicted dehydrogenase
MSDKTRIGFVGCGKNGRGHLSQLRQIDDANVVAVCDTQETLVAQAAEGTDAKAYTNFHQMLDDTELDAVYLSVPPFVHGEMEFALIDRGIPFYVEKPVTLDMKIGRQIADAVRAKNLLTCVGYQLRYFASVNAAREALANSVVGLVSGYYWCGSGRATMGTWWGERDKSGGQLVEQATHTLDMMRYLVSEINEVFCYEAQRQFTPDQTSCPDITAMTVKFANGAIGTMSCVSSLTPTDGFANVLDITFNEKYLRWSPASVVVKHEGKEDEASGKAIFNSADHAFVEAVRLKDQSLILSNYDEGLRTVAVTLAAAESARRNAPVQVSEMLEA